MEKLIVSMMRFSTAMTLFGIEQMQSMMGTMSGEGDMKKAVDKFRSAVDAMTDRLTQEIDDSKKKTLDSLTRLSEDSVQRAWDGMNMDMLDPSEAMKATMDVMKKTSDTVSEWMTKSETGKEAPARKSARAAS